MPTQAMADGDIFPREQKMTRNDGKSLDRVAVCGSAADAFPQLAASLKGIYAKAL